MPPDSRPTVAQPDDDPYLWLEEIEGSEALAWVERQNAETLKALNYTSGPSQRDILNFTTQLAVMIRAGISIRAALEGIAEQSENPKFKHILMTIKQDVESGKQFSEGAGRGKL